MKPHPLDPQEVLKKYERVGFGLWIEDLGLWI